MTLTRKQVEDAYAKRGIKFEAGDKTVEGWLKSGVSAESALETIGKAGRKELGTGKDSANKIHAQPHQDDDGNWVVPKYTAFGSTDPQKNFAHQTGHTQGTRDFINWSYANLANPEVIEKHNLKGTETFTGAGDEVWQEGGWLDLLQAGDITADQFQQNLLDFYKDPGGGVGVDPDPGGGVNPPGDFPLPQPQPPGGDDNNWWNQWADEEDFGNWLIKLFGDMQRPSWPEYGYGGYDPVGGVRQRRSNAAQMGRPYEGSRGWFNRGGSRFDPGAGNTFLQTTGVLNV